MDFLVLKTYLFIKWSCFFYFGKFRW